MWSITRQWRHPPSMSAGAGLGAESVLASVLGRTAALPQVPQAPHTWTLHDGIVLCNKVPPLLGSQHDPKTTVQ